MAAIIHSVAVAPVSCQRRAAGYLRVSTGKQVDSAISLTAPRRAEIVARNPGEVFRQFIACMLRKLDAAATAGAAGGTSDPPG